MPISHTCAACGLSLTRLIAAPEPVYGLPVVTCPGCRTSVVRRSDARRLLDRRTRRTVEAVRRVLVAVLVWGLMVLFLPLAMVMMMDLLRDARLTPTGVGAMLLGFQARDERFQAWLGDFGHIALVVWLVISAAAGAYATAALPHARRVVVTGALVAGVLGLLIVPEALIALAEWQPGTSLPNHVARQCQDLQDVAPVLPWTGAASLLGIPVGLRIRRIREAVRRRRSRKLRARLRRGRLSS